MKPLRMLYIWLVVAAVGCGDGTSDVTITISSPNGTVYTNDDVTIQVAVSGASPSEVTLTLDGDLLVNVTPPFSYSWDTSDFLEDTYELRAHFTAGGTKHESEPRTIVVDRTPPQVVDRDPSPNSDNVFVGDPIVVTFSEALNPSTVSSGSVAVTSTGDISVETTRLLAEDGTGLTILLAENPDIPTELTVALTDDITDMAGNALVVPPSNWQFALPFWQLVGGSTPLNIDAEQSGSVGNVATDGAQHLVASWTECSGGLETCMLYVKRWDGTEWNQLGSALTVDDRSTGFISPNLAVDSGDRPIVAFSFLRGPWNTHVQRWDGDTWQDLGNSLNRNVDDMAQGPMMAVDSDDNPIVTWREGPNDQGDILAKRWDGSSWQQLGTVLDIIPATAVLSTSIAVDSSDHPIIAWTEGPNDNHILYVKRWDGASWEQLGTHVSRNQTYDSQYPRIVVDDQDRPLVAWAEGPDGIVGNKSVYVKRWNGSAWSSLGGALESDVDNPASVGELALDQSGAPIVCVNETRESPTPDAAYVMIWDGGSWQQLGDPLFVSPSRTRTYCSGLSRAGSGYPVVAISEDKGVHIMRMNAVVHQ